MRSTTTTCLALTALAVCAACRGGKPPPDSTTAPPDALDAHVGKTQSSSPPSPSAPAPPPAAPSPFSVALVAPGTIWLSRTTGQRFVSDNFAIVRLDPDGFVQDEAMVTGFSRCMEYLGVIAGRWPDATFVSKLWTDEHFNGFGGIYRWTGKGWSRVLGSGPASPIGGTRLGVLGPWMNGTTLLMLTTTGRVRVGETDYFDFKTQDVQLRVLGGAAPTPQLERPARRNDHTCQVRLIPDQIVTLVTGDAFTLGPACEQDPAERQYVERWSKGAPKSVVEALPGAPTRGGAWALAARAGDDAYAVRIRQVADSVQWPAYLAHFDGTRWEAGTPPPADPEVAGPASGALDSSRAAVTAEGALFVVSSGLWRRAPGGEWEAVPLPAPPGDAAAGATLHPYGVWTDEDAVVWVTANYPLPAAADAAAEAPVEHRVVLLRTGWSRPAFEMKEKDRCGAQ